MIRELTPTAMNEPSITGYIERYETLRAYAERRDALPHRDGLAVLLHQGVAAWIEAWSNMPEVPPPLARPHPVRCTHLSEDASVEVTHILVAMAMSCIRQVSA